MLAGQFIGLRTELAAHAEVVIGGLCAGDGLENHAQRRALPNGVHLGGHVGENHQLGGDVVAADKAVDRIRDTPGALHIVFHRVDAHAGVAAAVGDALHHLDQDLLGVVGGAVGLVAEGQHARLADGGVAAGDVVNFAGAVDQIHGGHELGHGRRYLAGEGPAAAYQVVPRSFVVQNPLPQLADGHALEALVGGLVESVEIDPGHLVLFIGDGGVLGQLAHRQLGQDDLGRHPLRHGFGGHALKPVGGLGLVGLGQDIPDVAEGEGLAVQCGFQFHSAAPLLCAGRPLGARFKLVKFGCLCKTAQGQRLRCPWAASPVLLYAPP